MQSRWRTSALSTKASGKALDISQLANHVCAGARLHKPTQLGARIGGAFPGSSLDACSRLTFQENASGFAKTFQSLSDSLRGSTSIARTTSVCGVRPCKRLVAGTIFQNVQEAIGRPTSCPAREPAASHLDPVKRFHTQWYS